ncbi:protein kinase [Achlya hypogyna]|uniref:Protein kinase n=1 Tax=Achlya hypogyna TaxID=1202772 RepID=A0A1V9Z042_ACHHY|nr:protein kinase [Achlya hypogyna]
MALLRCLGIIAVLAAGTTVEGLACNASQPCYNHALNLCCPGDSSQSDGNGRPFCDVKLTGICQNYTNCYDVTTICACTGDRPCRSATGSCQPWSTLCTTTNVAMLYCSSEAPPTPLTTPTTVRDSADEDSSDQVSKTATTLTVIICVTVAFIAAMVLFCVCRRRHATPTLTTAVCIERSDREEALLPPPTNPRHPSTYAPTMTTSTVASIQSQDSLGSAMSSSREFDLCELEMYRIQSSEIAIVKPLAQGAHGEVLLGMYQGMTVAVKKMLQKAVSHEELHKFILEIKLMAKLDSSYIVAFVGASWLRPSDIMLVTEYMDMGDLRNFLQLTSTGTLTWPQKLQLAYDIIHGLVYLHSLDQKIIHRDLKSRNVLLNTKLNAKLTDFGISREMDDATMTAGIGTYRWMAPEVLQDGHYAESADVFSFGVILTELDTHRLPYSDYINGSGRPYTDTAIMAKVMMGDFRPTFSSECPDWFRAFGNKCMAFRPEDRPRAAEAATNSCVIGNANYGDAEGRPYCDRAGGLQCSNGANCYDSTFGCVCGGARPCRTALGYCAASFNSVCTRNATLCLAPGTNFIGAATAAPESTASTAVADGTTVTIITTVATVLGAVAAVALVIFAIRAKRKAQAAAAADALLQGQETSFTFEGGHPRSARKPSGSVPPSRRQTQLNSSVHTAGSTSSSGTSKGPFSLGDLDMHRLGVQDLTVDRVLGQGAYGEVLLGHYAGAAVAIKRLLPTANTRDDVEKFIHEAQLVAKLESLYIVTFVGVAWNRPQELLLVTEYMPMGDLRTFLEANASVPWPTKLRIAHNIAEGLVYLHMLEIKVLHRDLKSRNVLLTDEIHAKLTDFGISREIDDATMTAGIGTYRWMAPEVLQDGHYDESADIFSLGVILTELDTHRLPYADLVNGSGCPYTDTAIMAKVMLGQLRPTFGNECPLWLLELGQRCLSDDPMARPRAAEVAYTIKRELRNIQ